MKPKLMETLATIIFFFLSSFLSTHDQTFLLHQQNPAADKSSSSSRLPPAQPTPTSSKRRRCTAPSTAPRSSPSKRLHRRQSNSDDSLRATTSDVDVSPSSVLSFPTQIFGDESPPAASTSNNSSVVRLSPLPSLLMPDSLQVRSSQLLRLRHLLLLQLAAVIVSSTGCLGFSMSRGWWFRF